MPANNDSVCTQTVYNLSSIIVYQLDVTFDTGDGSFTATALTTKFTGELLQIETNPDGAPTDNYDITLLDAESLDVLQSCAINRHTTTTQEVPIVFAGTSLNIHPVVDISDTLTLTITNQTDTSASVRIKLYVRKA